MKPARIQIIRHSRLPAAMAFACGLAITLGPSLQAQSAGNFDTRGIAPGVPGKRAAAKPGAKTPPAAAAEETGPVEIGPSRYVGTDELDAYVGLLASRFAMRNRTTDPFGQLQDPDAKPVVKPTIAKVKRRRTTASRSRPSPRSSPASR